MPKLRINWEELATALDTNLPEFEIEWYFDRQTGGCIYRSALDDENTRSAERQLLQEQPQRFIRIKPLSSEERLDMMTRFSITLTDKNLKELVWLALDSTEPAEAFQRLLQEFPLLAEGWSYFLRRQLLERAAAWLKAQGIEAENPPES